MRFPKCPSKVLGLCPDAAWNWHANTGMYAEPVLPLICLRFDVLYRDSQGNTGDKEDYSRKKDKGRRGKAAIRQPLPWPVSCTAAQRCSGSPPLRHSPEASGHFRKRHPHWPQTPTAGPPFLCNRDETGHIGLGHYLKPLSGN